MTVWEPPVNVLHRYTVHLSTIAYFVCEVEAYDPRQAGLRGLSIARGKRSVGDSPHGDIQVEAPELHCVAPCDTCVVAGLSVSRELQVDYTEVIPEPET